MEQQQIRNNNLKKKTVLVHVLLKLPYVLQRMARENTKNYDARAQLLSCLLNLLFSDFPLPVFFILSSNNLERDQKKASRYAVPDSTRLTTLIVFG